jgi:methionyl-tRNA synthetase
MAGRYCNGQVWATGTSAHQLAGAAERASQEYRRAMDALAIHEGAAAAFRIVDATNEFIAATTPWTLAKDPANADRVRQALFDATEAVRLAAVLLTPIIPSSCREILRRVGAPGPVEFDRDGRWRTDGQRTLTQDGPLWPRKEFKEIRVETPPSPQAPAPSPQTPASADGRISIDDFMKVELRVAKVLAAERVPKSNKLLKLLVDVGSETRTIVAGIAESYEPEALVGRTVAIVFNLKPAKLMGVESNGMVLAASPEGGKATLVGFDEAPPPGTRVR